MFYREVWCPYWNLAPATYQTLLLPQLTDRGVALVAVSPQTPNGSLSTQEKGADVQRRDQCRQHLAATSAS